MLGLAYLEQPLPHRLVRTDHRQPSMSSYCASSAIVTQPSRLRLVLFAGQLDRRELDGLGTLDAGRFHFERSRGCGTRTTRGGLGLRLGLGIVRLHSTLAFGAVLTCRGGGQLDVRAEHAKLLIVDRHLRTLEFAGMCGTAK